MSQRRSDKYGVNITISLRATKWFSLSWLERFAGLLAKYTFARLMVGA